MSILRVRQISNFLTIFDSSVYLRLSPSISVYLLLNPFYSVLDQAERYYLYLSISLPPLNACVVKEWRSILRTKPEEGTVPTPAPLPHPSCVIVPHTHPPPELLSDGLCSQNLSIYLSLFPGRA
jgi:hypothetical protein